MIFGNLFGGFKNISATLTKVKDVLNYDFGSLYKKFDIDLSALNPKEIELLQQYVDSLGSKGVPNVAAFNSAMGETSETLKIQANQFATLNQAYRNGEISASQYAAATSSLSTVQKTATATSKALAIGLNMLTNVGIMLAITAITQGLSWLADKLIVTKSELEDFRTDAINSMKELSDKAKTFTEDQQSISDLLKSYGELTNSSDDSKESKEELLKIQESLVDKYGEEAEKIDLLNDKYDTNIAKIKELSRADYENWKKENASEIARAKQLSGYDIGWYHENGYANLEAFKAYGQNYLKGAIAQQDELAASLYVVKDVSEDIQDIYKDISGIEFTDGIFSNDLYLSGSLTQARNQLSDLLDKMTELGYSGDDLQPIEDRYNELNDMLEQTADVMSIINQFEPTYPQPLSEWADWNNIDLSELKENVDEIADTLVETPEEIRSAWFESLDEMQKGSLANIDKMKSALQTIAGGDALSATDFWALAELDTDRVLDGVKMVGDKFQVTDQQLIRLKDSYIQKQIASIQANNVELEGEKQKVDTLIEENRYKERLRALSHADMSKESTRAEYEQLSNELKQAERNSKEYGNSIYRNNLLIKQLNGSLGNTVNKQQAIADQQKKITELQKQLNDEVSQLNKEADNLAKAQEYRIDQIVDGFEEEKEALEKDKELLEEQLSTLEAQQEELERLLDNYASIADIVDNTISTQIEEVEKNKAQIEDYYNNLIDKLKEENEERESALDYAEKLAAIENAKNNRVRTYSSATGWTYEVNKEALSQAQEALAQADSERAIKALEKERDAALEGFDDQIKSLESYAQQWKDVKEEERVAEEERLAEQILGADWRVKISEQDISLLTKYRAEYRNYNAQLKTLTNSEMAMVKQSIEAKDKEIAAKQEQIDAWNKYKSEVQKAISDLKAQNEGYLDLLDQIALDENSTFYDREVNLWNFKENYKAYLDEIAAKQQEIENLNNSLQDLQTTTENLSGGISVNVDFDFENVKSKFDDIADKISDVFARAFDKLPGFANGGAASYTGLAMIHGTKTQSETFFSAAQSKSLYDMVASGQFSAQVAERAYDGIASAIRGISSTNTSNQSIHVDNININGVQQPTELRNALQREFGGLMRDYWKTKKTESQVY